MDDAGAQRAGRGAPVVARLDDADTTVGQRRIEWGGPFKLVGALAGLVALGWVLGVVAQDVLANPLDGPVFRFVVRNRSDGLTSVAGALTNLGAPALLLVVVVGLGWAWWAWRATPVPLVMLLVAWLGAEVLFNAVKLIVDRPRPPTALAIQHFGGLAFPSGHATQAVAVWGMVTALAFLSARARRDKVAVLVVAVTIAAVVGVTRVYLGAHWASDVFGGWLLGALWIGAVLWIVRPSKRLDANRPDGLVVDTNV